MIARPVLLIAGLLVGAGVAVADDSREQPDTPDTLETVRANIRELRAPDVAWRKIAWRSCLLDGLREARREKKPLMLWIFIDRPLDDQRC